MHEPIIFEATEAKAEYLESINMLLPQLSQSAQPMTIEALNTIITSPDTNLLLLQQEGKIVGMCTLAVYYGQQGMDRGRSDRQQYAWQEAGQTAD